MTLSKRITIDCELADEHVLADLVKALEIITGYMVDNVVITSEDAIPADRQALIQEYATASPQRAAEILRILVPDVV